MPIILWVWVRKQHAPPRDWHYDEKEGTKPQMYILEETMVHVHQVLFFPLSRLKWLHFSPLLAVMCGPCDCILANVVHKKWCKLLSSLSLSLKPCHRDLQPSHALLQRIWGIILKRCHHRIDRSWIPEFMCLWKKLYLCQVTEIYRSICYCNITDLF
jgi:hypothetical protein